MRCSNNDSIPDTDERCQAIILDESEEYVVVIQERSYPLRLRKWGFPKGKVKVGETERECRHREVCEEVGLQIPQFPHSYKNSVYSRGKPSFSTQLIRIHKPYTEIPLEKGEEVNVAQWMKISDLIADVKIHGADKWNSLFRKSVYLIGGPKPSPRRQRKYYKK